VLDRKRVRIGTERSARKEPLDEAEVRALLKRVDTVIVARGKKSSQFAAGEVKPGDLKGPTGNFRAPMIVKDRTLIVGFSAEGLEALV
jgi:hypothetical protein